MANKPNPANAGRLPGFQFERLWLGIAEPPLAGIGASLIRVRNQK
jgi:hypothetical protein